MIEMIGTNVDGVLFSFEICLFLVFYASDFLLVCCVSRVLFVGKGYLIVCSLNFLILMMEIIVNKLWTFLFKFVTFVFFG